MLGHEELPILGCGMSEEPKGLGTALADEYLARQGVARETMIAEVHARTVDHPEVEPWAQLAPSGTLLEWLAANFDPPVNARAIVVGCRSCDNAEELADWGFSVTAFDQSLNRVQGCRDRFAGSAVTYVVAEPYVVQPQFIGAFQVVVCSDTLESMSLEERSGTLLNLSLLLSPGGLLLLTWRDPVESTGIPPLSRSDLAILEEVGRLRVLSLSESLNAGEPARRELNATYQRPL